MNKWGAQVAESSSENFAIVKLCCFVFLFLKTQGYFPESLKSKQYNAKNYLMNHL